jgi:AGCS family alanine or glycine:cation symporter
VTDLSAIVETIGNWVWGPVTLALLVGTGLFYTVALKGLQFRLLFRDRPRRVRCLERRQS